MTAAEKILAFLRNGFETTVFFAAVAAKENFRHYVRRAGPVGKPSDEIILLANGPSLGDELPRLLARGEHLHRDVLCVNYFAEDERFELVRPKYYVLSDPVFFRRRGDRERVKNLYETLDRKVSWPMTLYVQYYNPDGFDYRAAVPNPFVRIVRFHSQVYKGFPKMESACLRRGWAAANYGSVIQNGELIAMNLGYKTLHLYGVDHTFFDGLCVDGRNRLCARRTYYYDPEPRTEPLLLTSAEPPAPYTVHSYLAEKAELFRGHEVLSRYAAGLGVRIVNHTKDSLIDCYERA